MVGRKTTNRNYDILFKSSGIDKSDIPIILKVKDKF